MVPLARLGAWLALLAGVVAALVAVRTPVAPARTLAAAAPTPPSHSVRRVIAADSLRGAVGARDVFRRARRPSPQSFNPEMLGADEEHPALADAAEPKPQLALVGLVGGSAPAAVIEGFPGVDGVRVVRAGDEVSGLTVRRIGNGEVEIAGMDTVWVLTVREPWR